MTDIMIRYPRVHENSLSVVIPVFNDARRLALCLEAVSRQTWPKERLQVVVVDNASTEDIRAVVARFPGAAYAHEPARGPAAARNRGVSLSTGEILAFTDADCLPEPRWLEHGVRRLTAEKGCGVVGGRVDLAPADPARPTAAELYDRATYLDQRRHVERSHFAATANLFTYKKVFDEAGGFDTRFPAASGEDYEWGLRVHARGLRLVYCDEARVAHPAEASLPALGRKARRIREGLRQLREMRGERRSPVREALLALLRPVFVCARILRGDRLDSLRQKAAACRVAVQVHLASYRSQP
jgi:glycosyltransferase involved in cell wall biosynthesis